MGAKSTSASLIQTPRLGPSNDCLNTSMETRTLARVPPATWEHVPTHGIDVMCRPDRLPTPNDMGEQTCRQQLPVDYSKIHAASNDKCMSSLDCVVPAPFAGTDVPALPARIGIGFIDTPTGHDQALAATCLNSFARLPSGDNSKPSRFLPKSIAKYKPPSLTEYSI